MGHQPVNISDADRQAVSAAVAAAEAKSAGEIVTIIASESNTFHDVAVLWSALVKVLTVWITANMSEVEVNLIDRFLGRWASEWTPHHILALALTAATAKFLAMWLLQLWRPLRLALVPAALKSARVRDRAVRYFKVGAERRTHGRTGILIYLSLAEHRAEIVADEAIASKVAPEVWGDAMAAMIAEIRAGRPGAGMVAAVEQVGEVLARHFPRAEDDRNELPDRLIEL